jgi:hypothetical protein
VKKVVMPAICDALSNRGNKLKAKGFCKIEWDGKELSICGVIGPLPSGDCQGSAGQCTDAIRAGTPAAGWNREMLDKFCDIWDRWHLNGMNAACQHQRELGWLEQAKEEMTLYRYKLKREAYEKQRAAEEEALAHLRRGEPFTPDAEQIFYAALPSSMDVYDPINEEQAQYYEPWSNSSVYRATEKKTRGWVDFKDDPRGILCKPCPVCGYKYGTAWLHEDVPQEVIDWLFALPDTPVRPAWV